MKKYILAFVLGAIIFSGISGVTAYTIMANNIDFQSKNSNWNVNNVGDALNSLYTMKTSEDYSTDEKRIGTWVNGKPIYQKVFTNVNTGNGDANIVDITSLDVDEVIYLDINIKKQGNNTTASNSDSISVFTRMDINSKDYISLVTNNYDWQNRSSNVIFKYTKTTD